MHTALYSPGLGYYSAGSTKFGADGDFVTSPEISSLFGHILARQCAQVLDATDGGSVLEFGAGSGKLAVDLLSDHPVPSYSKLPGILPTHRSRYQTSMASCETLELWAYAYRSMLPNRHPSFA